MLLGFGVWMLLSARSSKKPDFRHQAGPGFLVTYLLTMANPLTIVLFAAFSAQLRFAGPAWEAASLALVLCSGSLVVQMTLALGASSLSPWLRGDRATRWVHAISGLAIALFGAWGLVD